MLKLMIFGGELGKGSSFSSVGFVEQLERKDVQIEDMIERHGALLGRERVAAQKKLDEGTEQHLADTKKLNKFYMKTKEENEKLKEKCEYWKECYEMQEKETDIEHQRYMKCIALVNWSGGFLTWDYDNRKPVAKVGKYHNIEKAVPEEWDALLDTLN